MSGGFTAAQRIAVMVVGVVGVLIPGLQPQLLGALAMGGGIDEAMLGHIATVELLAMGLAATAAGALVGSRPLRPVAAVAIAAAVALDLATMGRDGMDLLALRATAGAAEGVLIWIAIGMIVRSAEPARWSGVYLAVQTVAQFLVATMLGLAIIPAGGASAGFAALAAATAIGLVALPFLPARYAAVAPGEFPPTGALPWRSVAALLAVVAYLAFVVAVWVYVEPLAHARDISAGTIALIAPLSLAMQIAGAASATWLATRLPAVPTLFAVAAANIALLLLMGTTTSAAVFLAATAIFGFLWLFALPFQISPVIAADPSRRAAALIGGVQLVGASIGPFLAALLVGHRIGMVLWFGAACIAVAMALFAVAAMPVRRARAET